MINQSRFITKSLCLVSSLFLISITQSETQAQPNILWIIGDDWGAHASAYGTPAVSTPNIDAVAAEGKVYTNAFVTAPVCSVMRSALITGMYQTAINSQHHRTRTKSSLPTGIETITEYFRDQGYYTSNGNANQNGNGKTDYNFSGSFGSIFDGNDWRDRPANTPFFSQVQIYDPHRGFRNENNDPNRPANLDLPGYYPDHELARKDYADYLADVETFDSKVGTVLNRLENDGLADNTIVMIFGDHGAPHIRDKQWLYDGGIRIPLIIRDPTGTFIPNGEAGTTDDRMISHIDISATSLSLAGASVPSHMDGVDFSDSSFTGRDEIFAAKDRLDGVVDRVRSVQVGNMKLIRNFDPGTPYMLGDVKESAYKFRQYPVHTLMKVMNGRGLLTPGQANFLTESRPEFELYDLSTDPEEMNNLAEDPAFAGVLNDLNGRITTWMADNNDTGGFDPDAVSEYNSMQNNLDNTISDRVAPDATDYEYLEWWADQYNIADLNLAESTPDFNQIRLPNKSWENTNLNNGAWNVNTPQGWTEHNNTVVQNHTANQMADEAHDGANALILDSVQSQTRWAMDDNWGNRVEFGEAAGWEIELEVWVGRRSDSQGVDAGVLLVSLQNTAGDLVMNEVFDLDGNVAQGTWEKQTFTFRVTDDVVNLAGSDEQLYLAIGNIVQGMTSNKNGRVLVDDMSLTITQFLQGDYNDDGIVNAADYTVWRDNLGNTVNPFEQGDGNGDGLVDQADHDIWKNHFGETLSVAPASAVESANAVPEPASGLLFAMAAISLSCFAGRK